MKKVILPFIAALLFSCSKKERYYGTWSQPYFNSKVMKITKDSISLSDDGNQWSTYPVIIKNNSLTFLNHTFETTFSSDSLIFENTPYVKNTITPPMLEIELPKLTKYHFQEPNPAGQLVYIQYGKAPKSDEYKLQLNDRYADFSELDNFFFDQIESCSKRALPPRIVFICDKEAKMEDVEFIFLEMTKINAQTYYAVNHIEYQVVDNEIKQMYFSQKHQITPIYNVNYKTKTDDNTVNGFHFLSHSILERSKAENHQYLFLINNEFYIGQEKYSLEVFAEKVDSIVFKNPLFISLFDLNSDFKHYTIFNTVINNSYKKLYDSSSKQKYNTTYNQLDDEKKVSIRALHPKKTIQNISIPHFLSFEETPIENIEFPFKNVKEQIPAAYFE